MKAAMSRRIPREQYGLVAQIYPYHAKPVILKLFFMHHERIIHGRSAYPVYFGECERFGAETVVTQIIPEFCVLAHV